MQPFFSFCMKFYIFSTTFLWISSFHKEQMGILALHKKVLQENLITYTVFQHTAHFTAPLWKQSYGVVTLLLLVQ